MVIRIALQERKRVWFWEEILFNALITSPEFSAFHAEISRMDDRAGVKCIDIGDNLRNLVRRPKKGGRGVELKEINLWQQYQT